MSRNYPLNTIETVEVEKMDSQQLRLRLKALTEWRAYIRTEAALITLVLLQRKVKGEEDND